MDDPGYLRLVEHYEGCLARHGDTHLGVDWPHADDAARRYAVMLDVIRQGSVNPSLLDFGCGAGHLYDYLLQAELDPIRYAGLDLSAQFVELCRAKHPDVPFYQADILAGGIEGMPRFDYVVANGVFTEKRELSFDAMLAFFEAMLPRMFALAKVGIAFNVMSSHVDWERDDLFHLPLDVLGRFLTKNVTRHFSTRSDYGLYEYTVYVYREPMPWPRSSSSG